MPEGENKTQKIDQVLHKEGNVKMLKSKLYLIQFQEILKKLFQFDLSFIQF